MADVSYHGGGGHYRGVDCIVLVTSRRMGLYVFQFVYVTAKRDYKTPQFRHNCELCICAQDTAIRVNPASFRRISVRLVREQIQNHKIGFGSSYLGKLVRSPSHYPLVLGPILDGLRHYPSLI